MGARIARPVPKIAVTEGNRTLNACTVALERFAHRPEPVGGSTEPRRQTPLRLAHLETALEWPARLLPERSRRDGREPRRVEAELLADHRGERVAVQHLGARDMPEARKPPLAELHAGQGHIGVVRRA